MSALLFVCLLACAGNLCAQVSFGEPMLFNDGWRFSLSDSEGAKDLKFDDSGWQTVTLPHDWSIEGTPSRSLASCTGYLPGGIGWYRKVFDPRKEFNAQGSKSKVQGSKSKVQSPKYQDEKTYIYFEGVYNRSEVYLNGHLLGKRPNGYVSFMYDLTPWLQEGENVLAVRVDHSRNADSRWYTGSGIYRNVWLVKAGSTHIAQWGVAYHTVSLSNDEAVISTDVQIDRGEENSKNQTPQPKNLKPQTSNLKPQNLTLLQELIDQTGKTVAKSTTAVNGDMAKQELCVKQPKAWSIDTPYLYILRTTLLSAGQPIDVTTTRVGLRTLQFDANHGFALNGRQMKVKGVCIHHDAGVLGAAVPKEVWRRRLVKLKEMGVNGLRMSHNPQSPDLYDLADELGLLIMDEGSDEWEFPKRKWLEGWNKGTPGYDGTFDFFEEWIERDIADMVRRDRNHPSVFLWSVGNEVDYPNDPYSHPILDGDQAGISQPMYGGYKKDAPRAERIGEIAKRLAAVIRANDPWRKVTGALAGVVMSNQTDFPTAVDVCGYNYTENRYQTDHQLYPERIIYGSETSTNLNSWQAVRDNEHIFGHFVWTGYDYLGESGAWPSRGLGTGLIDFCGDQKARGHFYESLWSTHPVAYIGTQAIRTPRNGFAGDNQRQNAQSAESQNQRAARPQNLSTDAIDTWNYRDGQTVRVLCYTNCPSARLELNGKPVGETKPHDDRTGIIYWDIPYEAGTLRVVGLDKQGQPAADYEIRTHGQAAKMQARVDTDGSTPDDRVVHVIIDIVDADGIRVAQARNAVKCEVIAGGQLLGLETGSNSDMSHPKANERNASRGRLLAYILRETAGKSTQSPKPKTKLRFTSEGLPDLEVEI